MGNDVVIFNGSNVNLRVLASGAEKATVLSRKGFKEAKGLTNSDAKRQYPQYLIEMGVAGNTNIAALIASNRILAQVVTRKGDETTVKFVDSASSRFETPADKVSSKAVISAKDAEIKAQAERIAKLEALIEAGASK